MKTQADTLFFRDGEQKIDMVLAFEDPVGKTDEEMTKFRKRSSYVQKLKAKDFKLELESSKV